jgi:predicted ATPase
MGPEEVDETTRLLGALIGLGSGDEPAEEPVQLFFAARRFAEQVALEQPTVFVFEDIHWADAAQLDLLEYLASLSGTRRRRSSRWPAPSCSR